MTFSVCVLSAATLSGCTNGCPPCVCATALAPGTTSPSIAAVTKMRSPQTMGDECPLGSSVFHAMFLFGAHSVGSCFSVEMPCPAGPRHCGQFSADTLAARTTTALAVAKR